MGSESPHPRRAATGTELAVANETLGLGNAFTACPMAASQWPLGAERGKHRHSTPAAGQQLAEQAQMGPQAPSSSAAAPLHTDYSQRPVSKAGRAECAGRRQRAHLRTFPTPVPRARRSDRASERTGFRPPEHHPVSPAGIGTLATAKRRRAARRRGPGAQRTTAADQRNAFSFPSGS